LRAHRHMLRREDLEDCLSQAVCELLARARRGQRFSSRDHLANALEQRFVSRVYDRRRALAGRSPLQAALEGALPLGGMGEREVELADPRAEIHPLVAHRLQLRSVARVGQRLTADQRLVLVCQIAGVDRGEVCRRFGWSFEKYRKVAQRARARLRGLIDAEPWDGGPDPVAAGGRDKPPAAGGMCGPLAVGGGRELVATEGRRELAATEGRHDLVAAGGRREPAALDAGLGCAEGDARAGVPARGEPCAHEVEVAVSHRGDRVGTER
jgi:DNA-directed RNA polymerase specialized sigma24 family protein